MTRLISKPFILIISVFFLLLLNSCASKENSNCPEGAICNDELQTTDTGLKYIHHIHYPKTRKPKYNEILTMHYLLLGDNGDTIANTYKLNEPIGQPLLGPAYKGSIEEGLRMMNVGDSATFYVTMDSIKDENLPFPPTMRKSIKEIYYVMKLYNTQSKAAFDIDEEARLKKRTQAQVAIQDKKIKEYLKQSSLFDSTKRHPTGLYYKIIKNGKGMPAQLGDSVSFTYKTSLLPKGLFVDESKKGQPIGFVVGKTNVLSAWQIAFTQLANKGAKISLFSPSHLAFGNKKFQNLPAFSMLHFEIEVVDIIRKNEMK
ncbi:FKBP-type peptidyl-prolyl cis-trans isomerase [Bernardetia litoralis DSM 6794]|uniref:Peptidyl-prolyl cis-trans isomerase n=1 Tax=Bernardetia litoralis (strain ATCC 23117 / DSM 6794 / NBRC 15988 / NCIMB 1366 / Fx l1 / Sio-4) TaxID=880071 RepID=I4AH60_BERLS|nr:FKBP-type peptidyl-prolyl cis-trans isomerase [Bernardetia litoralis]AFM03295.1 FKBP-type peptidyl-prolyl cis-trans isomerase [Bernardetia litoralis DSM 6794]